MRIRSGVAALTLALGCAGCEVSESGTTPQTARAPAVAATPAEGERTLTVRVDGL